MAVEYLVTAFYIGNTGSNGAKAGEPAIATTITLTDSSEDGLIVEDSSDRLEGEEIYTLRDDSTLELTSGHVTNGWYLELELPSDEKDIYFVPIDGTIPEDSSIAEDVDKNGDQEGNVCDLSPVEESEPDGIVSGTASADLIDIDYSGDPDGDRIDATDAILPGAKPNDDFVLAGAGNDTVLAGLQDDQVFGGTGDDSLLGENGQDTLLGEDDDDTLDGGNGKDSLVGGEGHDSLSGGNGKDTLEGNEGNDTLEGGNAKDFILGGTGDDSIVGGRSGDKADGGAGNDTFDGTGGGEDDLFGDDDRDLFINTGIGTTLDGGDGGDDFDTLDLRGTAGDGSFKITYTSEDLEDGFVTYFDRNGDETGQIDFFDIEKVIPICFTPGTLIATPEGERPVENLRAGDKVITRDNGIQEISWTGSRGLKGSELDRSPHLKPIHIARGALGDDLPAQDMWLSPNHRVLVASDKTALYFEEREVLVAAKHLTALKGVSVANPRWTNYIHFMCTQHEVVLSNGSWTESFQPGDYSLNGIGNAQRLEIQELFPELETPSGRASYQAARRSLKCYEARLLTHRENERA